MNISDTPPWPLPVGIIGAGAVGLALGRALVTCGVPLVGIGTRGPLVRDFPDDIPLCTHAEIAATARLIVLAVPDAAIVPVARSLTWGARQWVIHCAGSQPAALLAPTIGPAQAGALHPLAAFPRRVAPPPPGDNAFAGRTVAVDGAPEVAAGLAALATRLGATPITVPPEARAAYHLAASLVSNLAMALVAQAGDVWAAAGLPPGAVLPALLPLIASTHDALATFGLPAALVGPVARGDAATIAQHLAVLAADPTLADVAAAYRSLVRRAVALARANGRTRPEALAEILRQVED